MVRLVSIRLLATVVSVITAVSFASATASAPQVTLYPGVARIPGNNNTAWRSSVVLHNPTAAPQRVTLELLPRDSAAVAARQSVDLAPGQTREIPNLYDYLRVADGAGMLRVTGDAIAWVRAYNEGAGTFGQDLPAISPSQAFSPNEARVFAYSTPNDIKRDFRSNLMLVNLDTVDVTVTMIAGAATATKVVSAGAYVQINNLGAFIKTPAGFGSVRVTADGNWYGLISTIDPFTGDPTTIRGVAPSDTGERYFPAVAQKPGANGAAWRSEAVLYNAGTAAASVKLELIPRGTDQVAAIANVPMAVGQTRRISNVYEFLGVTEGAGTLRITGATLAWVRTYNQRPRTGSSAVETFGQDLPAVGRENAIDPGAFVVLPFQSPASVLSGFRSNLVLLNLEDHDITVSLRAGGATKEQAVPAGSYLQIDKLGAFLDMPVGVSCVWATADGRWSTAISTIDPITNDPTTFRAVEGWQPPTSEDLIDQALRSGSITSEQALTYKVFAAFSDSRLPAQLGGDDRGEREPACLREAGERFSSLSSATQNLIGPFLAPAYFQGSWWDLRRKGSGASATAPGVGALDTPCIPWIANCPINWSSWNSIAGAHVRVWYEVDRASTDLALANAIAGEVDQRIWLALTNLMGRAPLFTVFGDGKHVDILLGDGLGEGIGGVTMGFGCRKSAAYIVVNRAISDLRRMYAVVAHELMHAVQYSFEPRDCLSSYGWLMESTATWFEDYVYPGPPDPEHTLVQRYLANTKLSIEDMSVEDREYASYIFFFYLTRVRGTDELVIRYIWEATKGADQLGALEAGTKRAGAPLDKSWPDFAVYNVNLKPFDDYRTADRLGNRAVAQRYVDLTGASGDRFLEVDSGSSVELPHLSIRYFQFYAEDDSVSLVAVYNGLTRALDTIAVPEYGEAYTAKPVADSAAIKGAHIDVLVEIDGTWKRADWRNQPTLSFCRDFTKERFTSLIVILSNSDISTSHTVTPPGRYAPGLLVSNIGCAVWEGSTSLTYRWGKVITETMSVPSFRLEYFSDGYYDENTPLFRYYTVTAGTYAWAGSGTQDKCTYSGHASGSVVHGLDVLHTLPYVTAGTGKRGIVAGLFYPWLTPPQFMNYRCTPSGSGQQAWGGGNFFLSAIPGQPPAPIASSGKTMAINPAHTVTSIDVSGAWSLQARRE
jgi:hypothetical protein